MTEPTSSEAYALLNPRKHTLVPKIVCDHSNFLLRGRVFPSPEPQESEGCCRHAASAYAHVWLCAFPPPCDAAPLLGYRNSLSVKSVFTPAAARLPSAAAMTS